MIDLTVEALPPLGNVGKYFPGNRSCFRSELRGQDRLLTLRAHEDRLFTNVDRFKMRNIDHGLVHGNSAKEHATFSADKQVGVPARQMSLISVTEAYPHLRYPG